MMPELKTKDAAASQVQDIIEIEGIGPKMAKKLKKAGIKTTEDLRKTSMVEITELTGISTKLVYKFQCMADLFRCRRAAEEYTELLLVAGIETCLELSKQDPEELYELLKETAEEAQKKKGWHGDVRRIPPPKDVETMVQSAKDLIANK